MNPGLWAVWSLAQWMAGRKQPGSPSVGPSPTSRQKWSNKTPARSSRLRLPGAQEAPPKGGAVSGPEESALPSALDLSQQPLGLCPLGRPNELAAAYLQTGVASRRGRLRALGQVLPVVPPHTAASTGAGTHRRRQGAASQVGRGHQEGRGLGASQTQQHNPGPRCTLLLDWLGELDKPKGLCLPICEMGTGLLASESSCEKAKRPQLGKRNLTRCGQ